MAKNQSTDGSSSGSFSAEERAAMRERAKEAKSQATKAEAEAEVVASIAKMPEPDRTLAGRIHELIKQTIPSMDAGTWYGMPAYYLDGKNICFFQIASKFKSRYCTLGFNPDAQLDDGQMWPTAFAVLEITPTVEARIVKLILEATKAKSLL
jgi:uncharacterized protein YdhG (YjbR/CyaY superfamily)